MSDPDPRAAIYALLSRLLARELDADAIAALRQPAVAEVLDGIVPGVAATLETWNDASAEAHDEAFTRLFLLPGGTPPRASAWLPHERDRLGAGIARASTALLSELGRTQVHATCVGRLPDDHAALLFDLAGAALTEQPARGEAFVREAIAPWAGAFGRALAASSSPPLYRALGMLVAHLHPARSLPSAALETA